MRLTVILILVSAFGLFASETYAQSKRLTLKMENAKVEDVLATIQKQSEFYFFIYSEKVIDADRKVSVNLKNQNIDTVLQEVFAGTNVAYMINDRLIVLSTPEVLGAVNPVVVQQQRSVSGKVTDERDQPLPGVTIVVKGTTQGTITNNDGSYSIPNVQPSTTLVFSFVGMRTQEIVVGNQSTIIVRMEEETIGLEEVVAIGYGTVQKQDLTGAVATIQGNNISKRHDMKVSQALQGSVPGLLVTRNGSSPGANATIRLRGITSIGTSDPLIIIDGIRGDINNINPDDIESISVLKDAASASIYGSQAAAGVILITTNRGSEGTLDLDYTFNYGITTPTTKFDMPDAKRHMELWNEGTWNDTKNVGSEYSLYPQNVIDNYTTLHAENPDEYPDTNWTNLLVNNYAPFSKHFLSLTAGTKNINSKVSIGYDYNEGLDYSRTYERITVRANNSFIINKFIQSDLDLNYYRAIGNNPIQSVGINSVLPSFFPAELSDGRVAKGYTTASNPYAAVKYGGERNGFANVYNARFSIILTPFEDLKLTGTLAPFASDVYNKQMRHPIQYYNIQSDLPEGYISGYNRTNLNESRTNGKGYTSQFLINYLNNFGKNSINLMAGNEMYYTKTENLGAFSNNMELSTFPYLDLANDNYLDVSGNAHEYASNSFFGRIIYNYDKKYLFQANARYDGSSRFAQNYRWGFFPSFSVGWVITEEQFLENVEHLSFLKIRASYGTLGNERIGNYPYQSTIGFGTSVGMQGSNPVGLQTAAPSAYAIEDISWETTESYNLGVDLYAFDSKLRFIGDYYQKFTSDMLLPLEIPSFIGLSNPNQNAGEMNTKGWEFELSWNNNFGELSYSLSANLSNFKSIMGDLAGTQFLGNKVKFEGSEFDEWYGYLTDGLFQTAEEVANYPVLNANIMPGDLKYLDIGGPGGKPDGVISPEYDRVLLGGSLPKYLYGGNINLNFKNFDFLIGFQGVGKQNVAPDVGMTNATEDVRISYIDGNYWSKYNTDEENKNVKYPRVLLLLDSPNYRMADYWLINGAYLRIKNINIGYNVPISFSNKIAAKNIRVYIAATDPFCIHSYPKGWDPETSIGGYWTTSAYNLGISVKF